MNIEQVCWNAFMKKMKYYSKVYVKEILKESLHKTQDFKQVRIDSYSTNELNNSFKINGVVNSVYRTDKIMDLMYCEMPFTIDIKIISEKEYLNNKDESHEGLMYVHYHTIYYKIEILIDDLNTQKISEEKVYYRNTPLDLKEIKIDVPECIKKLALVMVSIEL